MGGKKNPKALKLGVLCLILAFDRAGGQWAKHLPTYQRTTDLLALLILLSVDYPVVLIAVRCGSCTVRGHTSCCCSAGLLHAPLLRGVVCSAIPLSSRYAMFTHKPHVNIPHLSPMYFPHDKPASYRQTKNENHNCHLVGQAINFHQRFLGFQNCVPSWGVP